MPVTQTEKQKKRIPIKNIYHMLSYAYEVLRQDSYSNLQAEEFDNVFELLTRVLVKGIDAQLKRGIYKEYINEVDSLSTVRGKIILNSTIKHRVNQSQKIVCEFDEFSENHILNQVLKATLLLLQRNKDLTSKTQKDIKRILFYFSNIDIISIRSILWGNLKYHRNNLSYKMLMNICYLIINSLLSNECEGKFKFATFLKDDLMARLYERFVYEFFKFELKNNGVKIGYQEQVKWDNENDIRTTDNTIIDLLPKMSTDITLETKTHKLVIDTKFYPNALQVSQYSDKGKIISGNLYQIFAYVKNTKFDGKISGMLLYPMVEHDLDEHPPYRISNNNIYVRTINLNQEFAKIRKDLLKIAEIVDDTTQQAKR